MTVARDRRVRRRGRARAAADRPGGDGHRLRLRRLDYGRVGLAVIALGHGLPPVRRDAQPGRARPRPRRAAAGAWLLAARRVRRLDGCRRWSTTSCCAPRSATPARRRCCARCSRCCTAGAPGARLTAPRTPQRSRTAAERRSANARTRLHASATLRPSPSSTDSPRCRSTATTSRSRRSGRAGSTRRWPSCSTTAAARTTGSTRATACCSTTRRRWPRARGVRVDRAARASRPAARAARSSSTRRRRASGSSPAAGCARASTTSSAGS